MKSETVFSKDKPLDTLIKNKEETPLRSLQNQR